MSTFTDLQDWYKALPTAGLWPRPKFETKQPVVWEVGRKGSGLEIVVPVGFSFDVSIPRGLWWVFSPSDPRFLKAACLHDFLLQKLGWGRVTCAAAFSDGLKASGVGWLTRLVMVLAVVAYKWR